MLLVSNHIYSNPLILKMLSPGKTSIFYTLNKSEDIIVTIPTIGMHTTSFLCDVTLGAGFNVETTNFKGINIHAWDVGGRSSMRPLWRHYFHDADGIVFVIDSNDRERMIYVEEEISRILAEDYLKGLPLLIFANKQDLPGAMSVLELENALGLSETLRGQRSYSIQACSVVQKQGIKEGFMWLRNQMSIPAPPIASPTVPEPLKEEHINKKVIESVVSTSSVTSAAGA